MGVVARQGIKYSIINYLSFLLGAFSVIFIYTSNTEFYGQIQFIIPAAGLIYPFVVFGLGYANIKYYPKLKAENQNIDFLWFSLKIIILNFVIIIIIYWLLAQYIDKIEQSNIWKMKQYIFPLVLLLSITQLISRYISNLKRVAVIGIFENIFPKLGALSAFCLYTYFNISENKSLYVFISFFILALIGIFIYFLTLNKDKRSDSLDVFQDKKLKKEAVYFCLFSVLGSLGSQLALNINNIMIPEMIDYNQNGIYSILMFIVTFLKIPLTSVLAIAAPVIIEKFENNKLDELKDFYQRVSKVLFLFGTFTLVCIFSGIQYLFALMKNGENLLNAQSIVYILGIATLFDLATGFNTQIIAYSKHFRFNIYSMLILAVLTIVLNYIFITFFQLGIQGVAIGTAISLTLYNIIKLIFNYKVFNIQPFSKSYIPILLTGGIAFGVSFIIPEFNNNLTNLIVKPSIVILVFLLANHWFNFLPIKDLRAINLKRFLTGK